MTLQEPRAVRWLPGRRRLVAVAFAIALVCGLGYLAARLDSGTAPADGCVAACSVTRAPAIRLPGSCALLSTADVAKAFGTEPAYSQPETGFNGCTWAGPPFVGHFGNEAVSIDVAQVSRQEFEKAYSTWIVPGPTPDSRRLARTTPVAGVGEAAFTENGNADLQVWYDGVVIDIETTSVSTPLATEKRLAEAAIARLRRLADAPSRT
jgi:hypothetical protein